MLRSGRQRHVLLCVLLLICACSADAKTVSIKIIVTTDTHGAIFPYDFIEAKTAPTSLAHVHAYVNAQRANLNQHVLLFDNGDILQGQPTVYYSNVEKTDAPHICADVMNFMQYDAGVVGNHDVEAGHAVYDTLAKAFQFPWLAANAVKVGTEDPYFGAYAIFEKDGVKIAALGLTTPGVPNWLPRHLWHGIEYQDMIASARRWAKIIREKERPDALIGLFHSGVDFTYNGATADTPMNENASSLVARRVPGFDVVFVGHDHRGWNTRTTNDAGESVLLLGGQPAARTVAVANLTFRYDESSQSWNKEVRGEIVAMNDIEPDQEFQQRFADFSAEVKAYVERPIGTFATTISSRDAMFGDSAFVAMIHRLQLDLTGADVSFAAPLSFDATINAGDIFARDLFKLYKYENLLYTTRLSGQEIKDFLEYSYGEWFDQMNSADDHLIAFKRDKWGKPHAKPSQTVTRYYNYDSAAGILYTVDVSKPVGERIIIASMADGAPFDLTKTYNVAVNSYRGNDGGGHLTTGAKIPKTELANRLLASTTQDLRYHLMKRIEEQRVVTPEPMGNWRVIPSDWWEKAKAADYMLLYKK